MSETLKGKLKNNIETSNLWYYEHDVVSAVEWLKKRVQERANFNLIKSVEDGYDDYYQGAGDALTEMLDLIDEAF